MAENTPNPGPNPGSDQPENRPAEEQPSGANEGQAEGQTQGDSPQGAPEQPVSADQASIDESLRAAREAVDEVNADAQSAGQPAAQQPSADETKAEPQPETQAATPNAHPFELQPLVDTGKDARPGGIDLLGDVNLDVKIELGRTRMFVEDVLRLKDGAVVELDKLAGDPVDVFVNERLIARGEVLVLNDSFCVRINEIVDHKAIEQARRHAS